MGDYECAFAEAEKWVAGHAPKTNPVQRVGARLAAGSPPGTVRAPLDAYGSTSDNTEWAAFGEAKLGLLREMVSGGTCNTGHRRNFRIEVAAGRRRRRRSRKPVCLLAMKIRYCEWSVDFSARRADRGSFASMGCPIVNTLVAHSSIAVMSSSLLRQSWNSAPPDEVRGPGTTPVSRALPRALSWSTILYRSPHTDSPSLYSWARWHLDHGQTPWPSDETTCPSSDGSTNGQDGSCSEDRRDFWSPWTALKEGPTTREPEGSPAQQRYEVIFDDPMQFAFADPLVLPASGATHCSSPNRSCRGLPTLRQATCQTLR